MKSLLVLLLVAALAVSVRSEAVEVDVDAVNEAVNEAEAEIESFIAQESAADADAQVEEDAESEAEAEAVVADATDEAVEEMAEATAEAEGEADTTADAEAEAEADATVDAEAAAQVEAEAESEAEMVSEAEAEAEAEAGAVANCMSTAGLAMIKSFEGFYPHMYKDVAGIPTIGYGTLCSDHLIDCSKPVTEPAAAAVLASDLIKHYGPCVARSVKATLNNNQYSALVSFAYNAGCGSLATVAGSTGLNKASGANYGGVGPAMERYNKAHVRGVLQVVAGLTRRRSAEAALFNSNAAATCIPASPLKSAAPGFHGVNHRRGRRHAHIQRKLQKLKKRQSLKSMIRDAAVTKAIARNKGKKAWNGWGVTKQQRKAAHFATMSQSDLKKQMRALRNLKRVSGRRGGRAGRKARRYSQRELRRKARALRNLKKWNAGAAKRAAKKAKRDAFLSAQAAAQADAERWKHRPYGARQVFDLRTGKVDLPAGTQINSVTLPPNATKKKNSH